MKEIPKTSDIIIVGAGVSGLYAAWRLLRKNRKLKLTILDRLDRTGGRLDTDLINIKNEIGEIFDVREEEGGMRFTYEMTELMSLFNGLGICNQIVDFPMTTNRFYVRGRSFTAEEVADNNNAIWGQLYNLNPAEQNQSPGTILNVIYNRILKANGVDGAPSNPTPEFWQDFRLKFKWKGITLNNWQLGGLFSDMGYSQECLKMMVDTVGFQAPFLSTVSAGEAWQILEDFPKNPHYHTFKDGFSTLTDTLKKEVEKMGGSIFTNINVISIAKSGKRKGQLEIVYEQTDSNNFHDDKNKTHIECSKVILAIASNAMSKLFIQSPVLNQAKNANQLWKDIHSVINMRLMKINLYFEKPWWRNGDTGQPPINFGPSFTDLPINAVYPFYPIEGVSNSNPAALTIYCDYNNTNFWQGLQNVGPKFDSPLQKEHSKKPQILFPASKAVVEEALKQLKQLFKTNYVPNPVMTSYRNWDGEDNFGFAYHQWGQKINDKEVISRMVKPVDGEDIFSCNEAWSDMQGWVNGSIRSTDLVLAEFNLKKITEEFTGCMKLDSDN
ncbi:FAD-dependent oxidoreductase [Algoriphagus sp.]|uniref:flavin monoamine oxidase family protein n=1 Tax=Algoriphagus sp. TaxID=1872435 RepID=UPI0025EAF949|nr:FAD-dependent oxidoreductase [Algoriphagus sp.]